MNGLSKDQLDLITQVLDEVVEQYSTNHHIIFASESERALLHFGELNRRLKEWKKDWDCIVPNCSRRAIKKSHALPRAMSLSSISESGHLLTPEFDHTCGELQLRRVGQNKASTFPGFCKKHEALFHGFEGSGKIDQSQHVYLQAYRSVCREHFRTGLILEQHSRAMTAYDMLRDKRLGKIVEERLRTMGFGNDFKVNELKLSSDAFKNQWKGVIESLRDYNNELEARLLPAFEKAVFLGDTSDAYVYAVNIDLQIPVALSGAAAFHANGESFERRVDQLISILPSHGNTLVTFGGHAANKEHIDAYVSTWMKNAFGMLAMVESWMVNGSDQWYLKPSVWDSLPTSRRTKILSAMYACEQNIGQEFHLSIFDGIRNQLLSMLDANEEKNEQYFKFVEEQRRKMTYFDFEMRQ